MDNWLFTMTGVGLFALVPAKAEVQEGDQAIALRGSKVPLIFRKVS